VCACASDGWGRQEHVSGRAKSPKPSGTAELEIMHTTAVNSTLVAGWARARGCAWLACLCGCLCFVATGLDARAQGLAPVGRITITPNRTWVLADDTDSVLLEINVVDPNGVAVPDGTEVTLSTTRGRLEQTTITTVAGSARVRFYSGGDAESDAEIMAMIGNQRAEHAVSISITREAGETVQGARVAHVKADGYLAFRDVGCVLVGYGKVEFEFRRLKITAEHLQFRLGAPYQLKADNAVVSNGKSEIKATSLFIEFGASQTQGAAFVTEPEPRTIMFVDEDFREGAWWAPDDRFRMWDLGESKVVVKCREALFFPGEKLVLRHARIYYDDVHVLTMSAHVIPVAGALTSPGAFPQVVGFNYPGGLFVDYPWYFVTDERYTGAVRVRRGSPAGLYTGRRGWYADVDFEYQNSDSNGGTLALEGLGQRDWGARWSHADTYSDTTQGSYSVWWPEHRYVSAYGNLYTQQGRGSRMVAGSWFGGEGLSENWYLESAWRRPTANLGGFSLGYGMTLGVERDLLLGGSYGRAGMNASLRPQKAWTLAGNLTLTPRAAGDIERRTNGQTESHTVVGLDAALQFSHRGSMGLSYDISSRQGAAYLNGTRHSLRGRAQYFTSGSRPLSVMLMGVQDLDSGRLTGYGWLTYEFQAKWTLEIVSTLNRTSAYDYQDHTFGIGRRMGQAELRLLYSTSLNRIEFEMTRIGTAF